MLDILTRAGSFIAIIFLGFFLKKIGFFKEEDFTILSRITIRITLPAAIIMNFSGKEIDPAMLGLGILGLGSGAIYLALGYFLNRHNTKDQQSFEMLNLTGYNIGSFVLPFAQSFLGPVGVISTSLFDTGNALVCLGGSYSLAAAVKEGNGFSAKRILKALGTSVPFVTYVIMVSVNLTRIPVPKLIISCAELIANANAFMPMLMIGVGFKLQSNRSQLGRLAKLLFIRYGVAIVLALTYYFVLPLDVEIRKTLVILAFSPIGSSVPAFTGELKGDVGLSSALNSLSLIISIIIIVSLLSVML